MRGLASRPSVRRAAESGPSTSSGSGARRRAAHGKLAGLVAWRSALAGSRAPSLQRQDDPDQPPPAAQDAEGEALRKGTLDAAQKWLGKEFTTQVKIDEMKNRSVVKVEDLPEFTAEDFPEGLGLKVQRNEPGLGAQVRKVRPFANYTTCVEFAMMVFKQAAQAQNPGDLEEGLRVAALLPQIFQTFGKETEVRATMAALQKMVDQYRKQEGEIEAEQRMRTEQLEKAESAPAGDPKVEMKRKQTIALTKGKLDALAKQLEILGGVRKKQEERVAKEGRKLEGLEAQNAAWIKPGPGFAAGGPKRGDLILTGQIKKGAFSVAGGQVTTLDTGAFRHIAILEEEPKVVDVGVVEFNTIDGGGTKAIKNVTFVRLSDNLVFYKKPPSTPPTKPGEGPAPSFLLLGWIDTARLLRTPTTTPSKASK